MHKLTWKKRIQSWIVAFFRPSHPTLIEIVKRVLAGLFVAQSLTVTVLICISALRRRKKQEHGFPHIELKEVRVGENSLQLYSYGRELFDVMLATIEDAKEFIYFETFIWKNDAVGQEFKEALEKKAAEGVAVYVIFDKFGNLVVPPEFYKSFSPKNSSFRISIY